MTYSLDSLKGGYIGDCIGLKMSGLNSKAGHVGDYIGE